MDWTHRLKEECDKQGIIFFTSPYDLNIIDEIDKFIPAYKIGSGDITYLEIIKAIALKKTIQRRTNSNAKRSQSFGVNNQTRQISGVNGDSSQYIYFRSIFPRFNLKHSTA